MYVKGHHYLSANKSHSLKTAIGSAYVVLSLAQLVTHVMFFILLIFSSQSPCDIRTISSYLTENFQVLDPLSKLSEVIQYASKFTLNIKAALCSQLE